MADLFDTDVLIDYLRGEADAVIFVEARIEDASISAVTVGEIYQGVRPNEEQQVATTLSAFQVLPVTTDIARTGVSNFFSNLRAPVTMVNQTPSSFSASS